jgi:hypothetical protein
VGWLVSKWGSYFLDQDLDMGGGRWERDLLGDLDLSIGVVYVGESHLLTSIKKVGLIS